MVACIPVVSMFRAEVEEGVEGVWAPYGLYYFCFLLAHFVFFAIQHLRSPIGNSIGWGQGRLAQGKGEVVGFQHWMFWELLLTLQVLQRSASKMQVKYFAILFRLEIS
jgi:hypothetical protein